MWRFQSFCHRFYLYLQNTWWAKLQLWRFTLSWEGILLMIVDSLWLNICVNGVTMEFLIFSALYDFLFLNISLSIATHAYRSKWQTLWSESTRYSSRIVFRSIPFQCIYTILPLFGHFCLGTLRKHHFFLPSHKAKPNPLFLLFTICYGCIRHYQSLYIMSFCLFEVNSIKKVVVIKSHLGENAISMDLQ